MVRNSSDDESDSIDPSSISITIPGIKWIELLHVEIFRALKDRTFVSRNFIGRNFMGRTFASRNCMGRTFISRNFMSRTFF